MNWTTVNFGKYAGKTIPQIVFHDPDWFFWAYSQGAFRGPLATEAEHVYRRARRIKVPQCESEQRVVEYTARGSDGKFATIELVPVTQSLHARSIRMSWIDLSFPRAGCHFDKCGGRRIAREVKFILFGSPSAPMTQERAGGFFGDDRNFELP